MQKTRIGLWRAIAIVRPGTIEPYTIGPRHGFSRAHAVRRMTGVLERIDRNVARKEAHAAEKVAINR